MLCYVGCQFSCKVLFLLLFKQLILLVLCRQLTWEVIAWLRSVTRLKLVVKGVMTPEDAAIAAWEHGVDGIWVSNHGGRQVDTAPATIEVLLRPLPVLRMEMSNSG